MTEKKITKVEVLEYIEAMITGEEIETRVSEQDVLDYVATTKNQLAAKAEKAALRAADKKTEGDELRATVLKSVTDEWQTGDQIASKIADTSKAKVVSRLGQLFRLGEIEKEVMKVEDRKLTCYKLA